MDIAWGADRPAPPTNKLRVHPLSLAGEAVADKGAFARGISQAVTALAALAVPGTASPSAFGPSPAVRRMAQAAAEKKADGVLVTALDEVAWLLNLRGADVAFNPVFLSYVIIAGEACLRGRWGSAMPVVDGSWREPPRPRMDADGAATLYVDAAKLTPEVSAHLNEGGVRVKGYEDGRGRPGNSCRAPAGGRRSRLRDTTPLAPRRRSPRRLPGPGASGQAHPGGPQEGVVRLRPRGDGDGRGAQGQEAEGEGTGTRAAGQGAPQLWAVVS